MARPVDAANPPGPDDLRVRAGIAPGSLYVRIICEPGRHVLTEYTFRAVDPEPKGTSDEEAVAAWLDEHPADTVFVYAYDGDSGDLVACIIAQPRGRRSMTGRYEPTPEERAAVRAAVRALPPLTDEQVDAIVLTLCAIEEQAKEEGRTRCRGAANPTAQPPDAKT